MLPHVINRQFIHLGLKFFLTLSLAFLCCHQDKIEFGSIESDIENRKYAQAESKLIKQLIQDSIKGDSHSIAASQILYSKLKFAQFKYDEALEHINKSIHITSENKYTSTYQEGLILKGDIFYELKDIPNCITTFDTLLYYAQLQKNKLNTAYAWNRLAICNLRLRNDSIALIFNLRSDSLAYSLKETEIPGHVHFVYGIHKYLNGKYDSALIHFFKSKEYFEKTNNKILIGYNYINLGACNNEIGQHQSALEFYQKALQIGLELENSKQLMMTYYNIASVYVSLGKNDEAKTNYLNALEYGKIQSNLIPTINSLIALGIIARETDYELAVNYFKESLKKSLLVPNAEQYEVKASQCLAETYDKYQKYDLAAEQFLQTKKIVDSSNNYFLKAEIYNQAGTFFAIHFNDKLAKSLCQHSLAYGSEINNHRIKKDACYCLFKVFESINDKGAALKYHKEYLSMKDSFENTNKLMEIGIIQARIENEKNKVKNDFEIKNLNNELTLKNESRNILAMTIFFLIVVLFFLFYLLNNISKKKKALSILNNKINSNSEMIMEQKIKLEESNRKLENFAYYAAHDIEAPVNKIRHRIEILKNELERQPNERDLILKETLKSTEYDANKLQEMISSLLYISKIDNYNSNSCELDLNILIIDIIETLKLQYQTTAIQFEIQKLPTLFADEGLIRSLFQNLIKNAIKFKKENEIASIGIWCSLQNNETYIFSIKDNGIGIDEDDLSTIFEAFKQVTNSMDGSGMGLAIVKKIVEFYGGKIWVESKLGEYTIIHFTLTKIFSNPLNQIQNTD